MVAIVLPQNGVKIGTNRQRAHAPCPATAKGDASSAKVHVAAFELHDFAEHRAGAIEKQQQGAEGVRADDAVQIPLCGSSSRQQTLQFRPRIDVRNERAFRSPSRRRQRQAVEFLSRLPVKKELEHDRVLVVPGRGRNRRTSEEVRDLINANFVERKITYLPVQGTKALRTFGPWGAVGLARIEVKLDTILKSQRNPPRRKSATLRKPRMSNLA